MGERWQVVGEWAGEEGWMRGGLDRRRGDVATVPLCTGASSARSNCRAKPLASSTIFKSPARQQHHLRASGVIEVLRLASEVQSTERFTSTKRLYEEDTRL